MSGVGFYEMIRENGEMCHTNCTDTAEQCERFVMKHGKDKYFSEMDAEKSKLYKHLSTTKFKKNRMIIHNGHTLHTDVVSDEELEKTSDCIKSGRLTLNLFCNWHGTDP